MPVTFRHHILSALQPLLDFHPRATIEFRGDTGCRNFQLLAHISTSRVDGTHYTIIYDRRLHHQRRNDNPIRFTFTSFAEIAIRGEWGGRSETILTTFSYASHVVGEAAFPPPPGRLVKIDRSKPELWHAKGDGVPEKRL